MAVAFEWLNDDNLVISDTAEIIYTNPASTITNISGIYLHNTHSSAITVALNLCPAAAAASDANQIYEAELDANETVAINDIPIILHTESDNLTAVAGTDAKVNIFVFGSKQT